MPKRKEQTEWAQEGLTYQEWKSRENGIAANEAEADEDMWLDGIVELLIENGYENDLEWALREIVKRLKKARLEKAREAQVT